MIAVQKKGLAEGHAWFAWLMENTNFDQLIWEHRKSAYWIHVSCKPDVKMNRHRVISQTHGKSGKQYPHSAGCGVGIIIMSIIVILTSL